MRRRLQDARLVPLGEAAWLLSFESRLSLEANARVLAVADALSRQRAPGVRDIVPAVSSLAVHFDPDTTDPETVAHVISGCLDAEATPDGARVIELPVCYGGEHGPDLPEVAEFAGCTTEEVVERHLAPEYRVLMLGFLPGFPYLGVVDERIAMPRRAAPRAHVAAGSVAIAGRQTGVYPTRSPGGWRVIGRTPLTLFDPGTDPPARLGPGDRVRFRRIDTATFTRFPLEGE